MDFLIPHQGSLVSLNFTTVPATVPSTQPKSLPLSVTPGQEILIGGEFGLFTAGVPIKQIMRVVELWYFLLYWLFSLRNSIVTNRNGNAFPDESSKSYCIVRGDMAAVYTRIYNASSSSYFFVIHPLSLFC